MKNIQSTTVSVDTFGFGETTWLNQRCYHAPLHLVLSGCTSLQSKWSACGTLESSGNSELVHREVLQWKGWNILHILQIYCISIYIIIYQKDQQIVPKPAGVACLIWIWPGLIDIIWKKQIPNSHSMEQLNRLKTCVSLTCISHVL